MKNLYELDVQKIKDGLNRTVSDALGTMSGLVIKQTPTGKPELWKSKPPTGYTPGAARGSWNASINDPESFFSKDHTDESGENAILKAKRVADGAPGSVFYLVSNCPWIRRLEYEGHSSQAPAGMVRISITQMNNILSEAIASTQQRGL